MRAPGQSIDDRTAALIPPFVWKDPDDVASVATEPNSTLAVCFHDGTSGVVHMGDLVLASQAGVYAELRDPSLFALARVALGTVTWRGGQDLAPDAMYDALRTWGEWNLA